MCLISYQKYSPFELNYGRAADAAPAIAQDEGRTQVSCRAVGHMQTLSATRTTDVM